MQDRVVAEHAGCNASAIDELKRGASAEAADMRMIAYDENCTIKEHEHIVSCHDHDGLTSSFPFKRSFGDLVARELCSGWQQLASSDQGGVRDRYAGEPHEYFFLRSDNECQP